MTSSAPLQTSTPPRRWQSLALWVARGVAALGGLVVVAWHLRLTAVLQVRPGFAGMQHNTALGFLLGGLALHETLAGRERRGRTLAVAVGVLGSVTLLQYLLEIDLGIDELFAEGYVTLQASSPGRMSPVTALGFALLGLGLTGAARAAWTPLAGLSASAVAGIGVAAITGYALGFPQAYRIGPWTSMAVHTAGSFVALGLAMAAVALLVGTQRAAPAWIGLFALAAGLPTNLLLYSALLARENEQSAQLLRVDGDRFAAMLVERLSERRVAAQRMARRWEASGGGTPLASWRADAEHYLRDYDLEAVAWIDSSLRVGDAVPAAPPTDTPGWLPEERVLRAALGAGPGGTGQPGAPLPSRSAGGFAILAPILEGSPGRGAIVLASRFEALLAVQPSSSSASLNVALYDGEERAYGSAPPLEGLRVEAPVAFPGGAWRLALSPSPEWVAASGSALPGMVLGAGTLMIGLLATLVVFASQSARRGNLLSVEIREGRRREARIRTLIESTPDGVVIVDPTGRIVLVNRQTERIFGYTREELLGHSVQMLIPGRFDKAHQGHVAGYFGSPTSRPMGDGRKLMGRRRDGSEFAVEVSLSPFVGEDETLAIAGVRDVTERERQREALESSLQEKETLIREIHHRVKNNLQLVSSLLRLQQRHLGDGHTLEALRELEERVQSMALIHENLYSDAGLSAVDFDAYLKQLAAEMRDAYAAGSRVGLEVKAALGRVDIAKALPLGLIVNELVSNAYKHAFPGDREGVLRISVTMEPSQRGVLSVEDDGVGLPDDWSERRERSLGLEIIETLSAQLGGDAHFEGGGGTRFRLEIPI